MPENIADAICTLYDNWVDEIAADDLDASCARSSDMRKTADDVIARGAVPSALLKPKDPVAAAVTLRALDQVMSDVVRGSGKGRATSALADVWVHYRRHGRFNTRDEDGALWPKRAASVRPGPPDYLRDALVSVVRVPERVHRRLNVIRVPARFDLDVIPPGEPLKVACTAAVDDLGHFRIEETTMATGAGYRLGPDVASLPAGRSAKILAELDASGAVLGVLPEGIADDGIVESWSKLVVEQPDVGSALKWILIGTGPVGGGVRPKNRAVLLDRVSGTVVASQDKRARFNMSHHSIGQYQLSAHLPVPEDHAEDISVGRELTVIESAAGRFCIEVCEDLDRLIIGGEMIAATNPTHILVPIFAREIRADDWQPVDASKLGYALGASVVVSNSLAVPKARHAAGATTDDLNTCVFHSPFDPGLGYDRTVIRAHVSPTEAIAVDLYFAAPV